MTQPQAITSMLANLTPGERYLIHFKVTPMPVEVLRNLSDYANVQATFLNRWSSAPFELLGTIATQDGVFIADVRIKGTIVAALIPILIQLILIIAGSLVAVYFIKAVPARIAESVSTQIEKETPASQILTPSSKVIIGAVAVVLILAFFASGR